MELKTIKNRKIYFAISAIFMLLSTVIFFTAKLNYWIDMTW
jgi:preprotein translocase subunit SecF